jgi:hypothetical protein
LEQPTEISDGSYSFEVGEDQILRKREIPDVTKTTNVSTLTDRRIAMQTSNSGPNEPDILAFSRMPFDASNVS